MWPLSEDKLFAKAKPLMDSESTGDWVRADGYLQQIRERFPETKYADQIAEFDKRRAMFQRTQRIRNLELTGDLPKTEIERRFLEAWRFEKFGDRLTAWEKYDALVKAFPKSDDRDDQAYIDLAQQRIAKFRSTADASQDGQKLSSIVRKRLDDAKSRAATDPVAARALLDSIITLYDGNQEVQPLVDEAREQIRALHGGPPSGGAGDSKDKDSREAKGVSAAP
jgi:serine/threonine-protein kinase